MSVLQKKNYTLNHNKLTRHSICSATFSLLLHTLLAGMTTRNQKVLTQIYPVSSGYIYFILSVYFFKVSWTFHWPFRNSFSESNTHTHTHTKTRKVIELPLKLRLWGSHLFYVDLGDWVIACIRVASFVTTSALTDPESHADRALMEFLADPFDVTWAMWILFPASALIH